MALTVSQHYMALPWRWMSSKCRAAAGAPTAGAAIHRSLYLATVLVACVLLGSPLAHSWTLAGRYSGSSRSSSAGSRIRFQQRLGSDNQELRAQPSSEAQEPPGPWALPFLGSATLLWGLLVGTPLQNMLAQFRKQHGPVFMLKTGPARQVWVGDVKALQQIYERLECSGRPVSFKDPFGEFLFLTREPEVAAPIKDRQRQWLEKNLKPDVVQGAVEDALSLLWPALDAAAAEEPTGPQASLGTEWPEKEVRSALYAAVTRAFLGEDGLLSEDEIGEFMEATREYSEMRAKSKSGGKGGDEKELPPGAARIRKVLETALIRSGRGGEKEALPLIVAASIGGAEIFPTLLHWIVLALAQDCALQERAASAAVTGNLREVLRVVYCVLRRTAYSVALGPPRKILQEVVVDGLVLPEGALLFALHPAIVDEALQHTPNDQDEVDFSEYAFGWGPRKCLGQPLAEALLPVVLASLLRRYHIAGLGQGKVSGVLKGQLIRPDNPPGIKWERRKS